MNLINTIRNEEGKWNSLIAKVYKTNATFLTKMKISAKRGVGRMNQGYRVDLWNTKDAKFNDFPWIQWFFSLFHIQLIWRFFMNLMHAWFSLQKFRSINVFYKYTNYVTKDSISRKFLFEITEFYCRMSRFYRKNFVKSTISRKFFFFLKLHT